MGGGVHKSLGNVGNSGQLTTGWYPVFVPRKLHVTYADGLFPTLQQNHQLWPVVNNKGEGTRSQPAVGSQAGFDQPQTLGEGGGASWSGEAGTAPPPLRGLPGHKPKTAKNGLFWVFPEVPWPGAQELFGHVPTPLAGGGRIWLLGVYVQVALQGPGFSHRGGGGRHNRGCTSSVAPYRSISENTHACCQKYSGMASPFGDGSASFSAFKHPGGQLGRI